MAQSECWADGNIHDTTGWLHGRILCLSHRGKFAIPRKVQQLIGSVIGMSMGDAHRQRAITGPYH